MDREVIVIEFIDYHLHSTNSFDGKDKLIDICKNAIKLKLDEICFTEHFSINPNDPSFNYLDFEKYSDEIEECRNSFGDIIAIKKGLEIGEPHIRRDGIDYYLKDKDIDFIIGAVHNIGDLKLRRYMQDREKEQIYMDYFKEVYSTVRYGDIDILGHLDLMKRYAFGYYGNYDFDNHKLSIGDILKEAIKRNIGIELNTSGMRSDVKEIFPSIHVLKLYRELGGEIVTVGSDSHSTDLV